MPQDQSPIPRRKFHRIAFLLAGLYNIGWGMVSSLDPQWLFRFSGMPPLNHPPLFACIGMIVGVYGILYLEVARRPEHGWLLAAVGLLGKVLGPLGMAVLLVQGIWPLKVIVLCLTNDLIWWIPFSLYLFDAWPTFVRDLRTAGTN